MLSVHINSYESILITFTYITSFLDRFFFTSEMLIVIVSCGKELNYGLIVTSC